MPGSHRQISYARGDVLPSPNMVTAEKARKRWAPLRNKLQAKLMVMMEEVSKLEELMFESATMAFGQKRSLISYMTTWLV